MARDEQMPERIARIIRENLSGVTSTDPDIRAAQEDDLMRTAELIAADLCASGQQVRALEWTDLGGGSFRAFLPIFGSVRVEPYGCCDWWEVLWSMPGQCDKLIPDVFDNPDDAKAAAQAEYERRILAALTPAPQPAGEAVPVSGNLFIDSDGDLCIAGRVNNLVACLATDDADGGWKPLNPDVFPEIVRRWNSHPPQPSETVAEAGLTVEQVQKAWTAERDRLTEENNRLEMQCFAQGKLISDLQIEIAALRALKG